MRRLLPRLAAQIACCFFLSGGLLSAGETRFPQKLTKFEPYAGNPVFAAGEPGNWDARIRERGWILKTDDRWWMWYTGYDGERSSTKLLGAGDLRRRRALEASSGQSARARLVGRGHDGRPPG